MNKVILILAVVSMSWIVSCTLTAQTTDFGSIGSLALSKNLGRYWNVKLEQELRFNNLSTTYNRSLTSVGVGYSIIRKVLKAELEYDFIHQRQNAIYEFRHRSSLAISTHFDYDVFQFELKTRGQATWRDESEGDYKFNPKYVWRNKLKCAYKIFGSPVRPFISGEIFCPLNSVNGFFMDGYRFTLGTKYRVSRHISFQFLVRCDQEIQQVNPKRVLYGGVGWECSL